MKKLLRLYLIFWRQEIMKQLMFRPAMAVFSYLAHAAWIGTTFIFLTVVSSNMASRDQLELLLFLSFFHSVKGVYWIYSSQSSAILTGSAFREGKIDFFLTRPMPNQWSISSFKPNIFALTDLFVGLGSFLYFASRLNLLSPIFIFNYLFSTICSAVLLYGVWFSYLTLVAPSGQASAAHGLMNLFWAFGQYPNKIYHGVSKFISTIVFPTIIITTLPMDVLLNRSSNLYLIGLFVSAALSIYVSSLLWNRMLRFYTSAN